MPRKPEFVARRPFTYGSVCSGIEAATTAWHPRGWKPAFFSEIEPFPCSVLAHHWPHVPNLGDMTKHKDWNHAQKIDLLVGGTPCQAFSIAGLRAGLADPRGNLTLTFLGLVDQFKPRWVVWENVPGVLSEKTGAFGLFLEGLAQLGYGWAYRILDAQYFGVAQRRRRVFVVACAGADWRRAASVLFEPDCLRGNPPPSREKGEGFAHDVAPCIGASGRGFGRGGDTRGQDPVVACYGGNNTSGPIDVSTAVRAHAGAHYDFEPRFTRTSGGQPSIELNPCLRADVNTGDGKPCVMTPTMRVRRLTPRECERLQGFPDDHTLVPHRGKPAADGPRYKAIGNSMAVPVMAWIGKRIQRIENGHE